MKKLIALVCTCLLLVSCKAQEVPTEFSQEALSDTFITYQGESLKFEEILESYKGQQIVIDVWASWCRDCIEGLPQLKAMQAEYPDVIFLFLSLDKGIDRWKKGIEKYQIQGEHYYMQSGWNGPFGEFLDLDWIPRYMVVDKEGNIKLFRSVKITDKNIIKALR